MERRISMILFFLLLSLEVLAHKVQISRTEAEFNTEKKRIEFISQVFIEDLEKTLHEQGYITKTTLSDQLSDQEQEKITAYFKTKFEVYVSGKKKKINFLGVRASVHDVEIFFWVEVKKDSQMEVKNAVLIDTFPKQINHLNFQNGENKQTFIFKKGEEVKKILMKE